MAELAGHGLAIFPAATAPGLYEETLRICRHHGFEPTDIHHTTNIEFLLGLVACGRHVAFDEGSIARKEPRVVWRPIVDAQLTWQIVAVWARRDPHGAAQRFAEIATRVLAELRSTARPLPSVRDPSLPRPWSVVFQPERQLSGSPRQELTGS